MNPLPIEESLPRLRGALEDSRRAVLDAPPGAGKTTRVPLALLEAGWMAGKKIIMLEPRRLAARRAAAYMAGLLGEEAGKTVGYRIRGETVAGSNTRIEVVTEGILTRLLHAAPDLPGVGLLIFDEFHERSMHADLGLAMALDVQENLREDLKILVMSATLDGIALARVLGDVPVVQSAGRSHEVRTKYLAHPWTGAIEREVARVVRRSLDESEGDILVFLPGVREIRRTGLMLAEGGLPGNVVAHALFGDADPESQRLALGPAAPGVRKVILATSIAETSLTIDGVRVVVDSGLSRIPRFDPRRGMTGLVTVPVSVASADQRRGRAGRQSPGECYRLWTEEQHKSLPAFSPPEILSADLAPLALDIARWGGGDGLRFIDPPPPPHIARARSTLRQLGALDSRWSLTPHGKAMSDLPIHPRLAHMIIRGRDLSLASLSCDLGALLEERDILSGPVRNDVDIASRVQALHASSPAGRTIRARVLAESRRLQAVAGGGGGSRDLSRLGLLVALAYPERVARRRPDSPGRYQMVNGAGALLPEGSALGREEFIAVADVDGIGTEVRIFLAAPIDRGDLLDAFRDAIVDEDEVFWNQADESVVARRVQRLGAISLGERGVPPRGEAVRDAMMEGIRLMGLGALPWGKGAESLRSRSEWLRRRGLARAEWPDLSDENLLGTLPLWLGPFLDGVTRRSHLGRLDMDAILRALFTHRAWSELDRLAPESITVPTGSKIRLDYASGEIPVLSVRLQEMFGQTDTPSVAGGGVSVLVHLLSPAGRPLAVTQDLRSFWSNAYQDVRKEMRGRYPKHVWPEDPLAAKPTGRTKRSTQRR
ncbi:MAG TPA: ATP-dependent helicase HrpB [Bacteroidota bacterium]|nr:ATP-dependent helicase HrpB [Bacteroidota bacterium]